MKGYGKVSYEVIKEDKIVPNAMYGTNGCYTDEYLHKTVSTLTVYNRGRVVHFHVDGPIINVKITRDVDNPGSAFLVSFFSIDTISTVYKHVALKDFTELQSF